MIEEWRPVVGWENLYEVSNLGQVKSLSRSPLHSDGRVRAFPTRIIASRKNSATGYVQACLHRNNKAKQAYVHRLVAEAFIPNPERKKYVNHLDGVRSNNVLTNLQWCTHQENIQHAYATGLAKALRGEEAANATITWQAAQRLRSEVWNVIREWSEAHGVHTQTAWDVIAERSWKNAI